MVISGSNPPMTQIPPATAPRPPENSNYAPLLLPYPAQPLRWFPVRLPFSPCLPCHKLEWHPDASTQVLYRPSFDFLLPANLSLLSLGLSLHFYSVSRSPSLPPNPFYDHKPTCYATDHPFHPAVFATAALVQTDTTTTSHFPPAKVYGSCLLPYVFF